MSLTKPITPDEVVDKKRGDMPEAVISIFNKLIAANYLNGKSTVKTKDALAMIAIKTNIPKQEIQDNGWLDIEDIYQDAGWKVVYDSPSIGDRYDAHFIFTKRKKNA